MTDTKTIVTDPLVGCCPHTGLITTRMNMEEVAQAAAHRPFLSESGEPIMIFDLGHGAAILTCKKCRGLYLVRPPETTQAYVP